MAYQVEVTPNPALEPGKFVPVSSGGKPVTHPTEEAADRIAEMMRERARRGGIGGGYAVRVVECGASEAAGLETEG